MNLPALVPTDNNASPAFRDKASCLSWLNQLQLTDLQRAHSTLRIQLDELNRYPMSGNDRLQILETLRETIEIVQFEYAKKFIGKKLPLNEEELVTFFVLLGLWQCMGLGYQRCLLAWEAGDKNLLAHGALLIHRCLRYAALQACEYLHIGYEINAKLWQQLHTFYAYAEAHELHHQPVADVRYNPDQANTPRTVYGLALLANHIANIGLTRWHWQAVERWLNAWGDETITLEPHCSISHGDALPLAVDMAGIQGLQTLSAAPIDDSVRYMAMVPLSKFIRIKTILLQQGKTPSQLGLGSGISSSEAVDLLNLLHRHWCEEQPASPSSNALMQVCYGLEELYAQLGKKPFKPVSKSLVADKASIQQIEAFGRVLSDTNRHDLVKLGFVLEEWLVEENHSMLGTRLMRQSIKGERLGLNQLVGVRAQGSDNLKIGAVKSVFIDRSGRLHISVRFMPGSAQAIVASGGEVNESSFSESAPGLILSEMPSLGIPASLLLPLNWFQANRKIEIMFTSSRSQSVILGFSVDKGADFERVSFTLA
jgi:hypothetical protein